MSQFLDKFPKILYNISGKLNPDYETVTNILFRIGIVKEVLNGISTYYEYTITEGDTPEILAEKIYGNPEAYWMILYANDIYDPHYDWPLNYRQFTNYIIDKYGSITDAQTSIHHHEKLIAREANDSGVVLLERLIVDEDALSEAPEGIPYDSYTSLAEDSYITYSLDGKTIVEGVSRMAITNYDWEVQQNEAKRNIKIIKKNYYYQIMQEFNNLTRTQPSFIRRLT